MEIRDLSREKIMEIHKNRLPGGYGVFFDDSGLMFATLNLFWNDWNQVMLCVEVEVSMTISDEMVYREIINVDRNPELWAIYNRDVQCFVNDEIYDFLNHHLLEAGSVEQFADQPPTTAQTTH